MSKNEAIYKAEQIRDEYRIGANTAERVGNALLAIIYAIKEVDIDMLFKMFLRKDTSDKTEHLLSLLGGVAFNNDKGIDKEGNALLDAIRASKVTAEEIEALVILTAKDLKAITAIINQATTLNLIVEELAKIHNLTVKDTASLVKTIVSEYISSPTYVSGMMGEGFKLYQAINGDWNLELDNLIVRKIFTIFEIVVQKIRHQGGVILHSAAGGVITKVTDLGDAWKCEHDGIDDFAIGDQVLCQVFKVKEGGTVKRYWRLATDAGNGYVTLSKTDMEKGSAIPEVGDEIIQLGNRTNTARQSAYEICVVGDNAPYTAYYSGINSYSTEGKQHTRIGNLSGITDKEFGALKGYGLYSQNAFLKGIFRLSNGKTIERAIEETTEYLGSNIDNVKLELQSSIREAENNFNSELSSTKAELGSSINQAQQTAENAQSAIDGLEIGGVNYLSDNQYLTNKWSGKTFVDEENSFRYKRETYGWGVYATPDAFKSLPVGEKLVLSGWFRASKTYAKPRINFAYPGDSSVNIYIPVPKANSWFYAYATIQLDEVPNRIYLLTDVKDDICDFANLAIEKGNKPTKSPISLDDIDESFQKDVKDVRTDFEIREGVISGKITEATNLVEESKTISGETKQTLVETTSRINQFNITAKEFESTLGEITKKQNEVEGSISDVKQTASELSVSIEGFRETEREIKETVTLIEATHEGIVLEASNTAAQKAIEGVDFGVFNLLNDTKFERGGWSGETFYDEELGVNYKSQGYSWGVFQTNLNIKKGKTITFSGFFRLKDFSSAPRMASQTTDRTNIYFPIPENAVVGQWFYSFKTITLKNDITTLYLLTDNASNVCDFALIKAVEGNKTTKEWSPSHEDTQSQFTETHSRLDVLSGSISAEVSRTDGLATQVSSLQQDHNSFKVEIRKEVASDIDKNNTKILSSFQMVGNTISLLGKDINLTGRISFSSLTPDAQNLINGKVSTETIIEGGFLKTHLIDVQELFAQRIEATNLHVSGDSTFAGELKGVTGSFKELKGTSAINNVGGKDHGKYASISFNPSNNMRIDGRVFFIDEPTFYDGVQIEGNLRQRFGTSLMDSVQAVYSFGFRYMNVIVVTGSTARYYHGGYNPNDSSTYTQRSLRETKGSDGKTYYGINLSITSGSTSAKDYRYTYNMVLIDVSSYFGYFFDSNLVGQAVFVAHINDRGTNCSIYGNGKSRNLGAGEAQTWICAGNAVKPYASSSFGAGWLLAGYYDNNW